MRSANRIWIAQFLWAFSGGLPFLLTPALIVAMTTVRQGAEISQIEIDQVRMVGAASMGLCFATALATTRQVLAWQRGMAAIFLVFMLQWAATLTMNQRTGLYEPFVPYLTVVPALGFALLNAVIMLQRGRDAPIAGIRVDAAPTRLRWLWAGQGAWYLLEAGVCLFAAEWVLGWVTGLGRGDGAISQMAIQQSRIVAAWTLTLALLSLYASLEHRIRDWRQYRWVFLLALLVRAGGIAANGFGTFDPVVAATLGVPALAFAYLGFRWTLGEAPTAFREADDPVKPHRSADSDAPPTPAGNGVVWLWLFQTVLFGVVGLVCLFGPRWMLGLVVNDVEIHSYATDALRLTGTLIIGITGFNVLALMMSRTSYRRYFGLAFFLAFAISAIAFWLQVASALYSGAMPVICAGLSILALLNLQAAVRRPPGLMSQNDAGVAGSKPSASFIGWLFQLLALVIAGLALIFAAHAVLGFLTGGLSREVVLADEGIALIHSQWSLVGVLSVTVAAITAIGMGSQSDYVWRGFAFFGSAAFVLLSVVLVFVTSTDRYHMFALTALAAGVVLFYLNRWIRLHPATWNTEDTNNHLDSWSLLDLVAGPLMGLQVLLTKRRASHLMGAAARGTFTVSPKLGLSGHGQENDFFKAGRDPLPVQVRFANLTELDDAALDVRGCSIKFSHQRFDSPLDILLNTGAYCPAFNLLTFAGFVASKFVPTFGSEAIVKANLVAREGGIAGLRRAPKSYSDLHYYSQIVRHWVDPLGVRYLVRYRSIPDGDVAESGLPSEKDASQIWLRDRLSDETEPTNYLRKQLVEQVGEEGIRLRLQAQFHEPVPGDTDDWYNASVEWDERDCPWVDVGQLELNEALSDADCELLQFNPGNHPMSLGIPRSDSPLDFRSMGDSEARVVRALQRFRLWMYKIFGPPAFGAVK